MIKKETVKYFYRLSPLQEGIFFHHLRDPSSVSYFNQLSFRMRGTFDVKAAMNSFQHIIDRHDILRTVFIQKPSGGLLQIVLKEQRADFSAFDLSNDNADKFIADYKSEDRRKGFHLGEGPLMRLCVIICDANVYELILSYHHILIDGWCIPIIIKEFFAAYNQLLAGEPESLLPAVPYIKYIQWLDKLDKDTSTHYWQRHLEGFKTEVALPLPKKNTENLFTLAGSSVMLSASSTKQLVALGKKYNVTLNTIIECCWGILLGRYNNTQDIVFGVVVSGRPTEVEDIEQIVGLFINTIPVRINTENVTTFSDLIKQVQDEAIQSEPHHYVQLAEVQGASAVGQRLVDHVMIFENYPLDDNLKSNTSTLGFSVSLTESFHRTDYDFNIVVLPGEKLIVNFNYNENRYDGEVVRRIGDHFTRIVEQVIVDPERKIEALDYLPADERTLVLNGFNDTFHKNACETVVKLVEQQAEKTPDAVALVCGSHLLTYRELNERSNQVAHLLCDRFGVGRTEVVGVMMERSAELIIALLGILKSGAAYLPLDVEYPKQRIAYIIKDAAVKLVLTDTFPRQVLDHDEVPSFPLEPNWFSSSGYPSGNLNLNMEDSDLAYVIYTSGSTGNPKGCQITHKNLSNYIRWANTYYFNDGSAGDWALYTSISFDLTVTSIYTALTRGRRLHVLESKPIDGLLIEAFSIEGLDTIKVTPSHLSLLKGLSLTQTSIRTVICGGEQLSWDQVRSLWAINTSIRIFNEYGPTETTVGCVVKEIKPEDERIVIGKPIWNTRIYVLDGAGHPAGVGIEGELYISGDCVGHGYRHNEILTRARFIDDPFNIGSMYRTGDKARWLPEGQLEYLGRIDEQVKIRGYRIELGEIENVLRESGLVEEAVVLATAEDQGNKKLVGYLVPKSNYDKEKLIVFLKGRLPEYMVPALLVPVEQMPLSVNGKIDKSALPKSTSDISSRQHVVPTNEFESLMANVWQDLLGVEKVGIRDNFFELGGDSIMSIQVVSRMRTKGYVLQVGDIFDHPIIEKLSALIKNKPGHEFISAEQGVLTGPCGLLPIQQWYFEKAAHPIFHFNQSLILGINKGISAIQLEIAVKHLVKYHDALRFRYTEEAGEWKQEYGTLEIKPLVRDVQSVPPTDLSNAIAEIVNQHQQSLDLEKGEIIRLVLIKTGILETHNRLFIVVHHLAIDGVSWRILLEHFETLLIAIKKGITPELGSKGSSYRDYFKALQRYSQTTRFISQKNYWEDTINRFTPLPVDYHADGNVKLKEWKNHITALAPEKTQALLQKVPHAYHTEINDILLSALAKTLTSWCGLSNVTVGLEGHGREDSLFKDIDTSRTVGWFTTIYPVLLTVEDGNLGSTIKQIKEQLRAVPDKGLGYFTMKYINREKEIVSKPAWDIVFNYLGQAGNVINKSEVFTGAPESSGHDIHDDYLISEKIVINGLVQQSGLTLNWGYSTKHFSVATIERLASEFVTYLEALIDHCSSQPQRMHTPSDYGLEKDISYQELDRFLDAHPEKARRQSISGIYRLSPLQEGMLFHSLFADEAGAYMNQFVCDIFDLNIDCLKQCWQHILKHHSILRSAFYYDIFKIPVQCVYNDVSLPLEILDLRHLKNDSRERDVQAYLKQDGKTPFDFTSAPLMRISLLRLEDHRVRLVWTCHHILTDGWSQSILMDEFLNTYERIVSNRNLPSRPEDKYEDYIRYLERQDKEAQQQHWRKYLDGVTEGTLLPFIHTDQNRNMGLGEYRIEDIRLDTVLTKEIEFYAQRNHLTINTIMQGVWAYLLHRYTGDDSVMFGVTVSGRPEELGSIENRVGIYINTLPLRSQFSKEEKIVTWLKTHQQAQTDSRRFQHSGLTDIQQWIGLKGNLFDTVLVFENYPVAKVIGANKSKLKIGDVYVNEFTNYPLSIVIVAKEDIEIKLDFNCGLLDRADAKKILFHFRNVLTQIIKNEEGDFTNINLLDPQEKDTLIKRLNQTDVDYGDYENIITLFDQQVHETQDRVALVFEDRSFTYQQISDMAGRVGNYLRKKGVTPGSLVPICIERSPEMIIGLLGIYKAHAGYIPLDPSYPADRLSYMVEDTGAKIILTSSACADLLRACKDGTIIQIDNEWDFINQESPQVIINNHDQQNIGYVIYTSGSTGRPKGVLMPEKALVNLLLWHQSLINPPTPFSVLQFASLNFDASFQEIFSALCFGGTLILIDEMKRKDMGEMLRCIDHNKVNHLFIPYVVLKNLASYAADENFYPSSLKYVFTAGEQLRLSNDIKKLSERTGTEIYNYYGPSETHVVTFYKVESSDYHKRLLPPIGKPIANTSIYIVDKTLELCPIGITGEICIGGIQVARGYWNAPLLTDAKFIDDIYGELPGEKLYRTGDKGRWLQDGTIEFLGRMDHQVKIWGNRVELGEIEAVLCEYPGISQAIVVAIENAHGEKALAAYVVKNGTVSMPMVSDFLKSRLPVYMIPFSLIEIPKVPLTNNGKVNKRALPSPSRSPESVLSYSSPENDLEKELITIWEDLLKVVKIGTRDNFFELGGHSLMATRVVSAVRRKLGLNINIKDVFSYTTIKEIANYIGGLRSTPPSQSFKALPRPTNIPLSFIQDHIWNRHPVKEKYTYTLPLFRFKGALNAKVLEEAFAEIVDRHEILRTVIKTNSGNHYQEIKPPGMWKMECLDVADILARGETLSHFTSQTLDASFDLSKDFMMKATLVRTGPQEHLLFLLLHHIAFDGWSMTLLKEELSALYNSKISSQQSSLKPLPLQYPDYAVWQQAYFKSEGFASKLNFWKAQLADVVPLSWPFDPMANLRRRNNKTQMNRTIPGSLVEKLKLFSQQQTVSMFMTLLTAYKVVLYRYTGHTDICVGTHVAGRQFAELENLIGYFANSIVLRTNIVDQQSFTSVLESVKKGALQAFEYQDVPFYKVVNPLSNSEHPSNAFCKAMFQYQNLPEGETFDIGKVMITAEGEGKITDDFDISLDASEVPGGLKLMVHFRDDVFSMASIDKILDDYIGLLQAIYEKSSVPIREL